jgi:hypothetical protein
MKTVVAEIGEVLRQLGIDPSDYDDNDVRDMVHRVHEFENEVMQYANVGHAETTITPELGTQGVLLEPEVGKITGLFLNYTGSTVQTAREITNYRVPVSAIITR